MVLKGSMDLSISTIVVVVLAISFLLIGLVMVQKLMCGALEGINAINDETKSQISDLFQSQQKLVVKERLNLVTKGISYGVGFGVRSIDTQSTQFSYNVKVSDIGTCEFSETEALSYISVGKSADFSLPLGEDYFGLINFDFPKSVGDCKLRYGIEVKDGSEIYSFEEFDVSINSKSFSKKICI